VVENHWWQRSGGVEPACATCGTQLPGVGHQLDRRAVGLFHRGSATVPARLRDATMIGITVKPSAGSPKPTAMPVLLFPVPA
jgi:hypothetical protein